MGLVHPGHASDTNEWRHLDTYIAAIVIEIQALINIQPQRTPLNPSGELRIIVSSFPKGWIQ